MKPKILVVEDDSTIASVIIDTLQLDGFDTTIAREGRRGVLEARSGRYSVVILDIMLPGKDGISILHEIRADPRTARRLMPRVGRRVASDPVSGDVNEVGRMR